MHLFVDVTAHGFGHLAITAPVLNELAARCPGLRLTLRSALPESTLRDRIDAPFTLRAEASDFGFAMLDATRVDIPRSAAAYQAAHADWANRVADEARQLAALAPDLVLSSVSALPLAGAQQAGLPCAALCSLNWADLFAQILPEADWAPNVHRQLLAAYAQADAFLRTTPGMPMTALGNVQDIGVIAAQGTRQPLPLPGRCALVAMGGIAHRLPIEDWPRNTGWQWLVPAHWQCRHPDAHPWESLGLGFTDLLASVDAIITKPGYGTFTEATCCATPVLFQRRTDWPEQDCLIDWLHAHGRCGEITGEQLAQGDVQAALAQLLAQPARPAVIADGAARAATVLKALAGRNA